MQVKLLLPKEKGKLVPSETLQQTAVLGYE